MEKKIEIVIKEEKDVFDKYSYNQLNKELIDYMVKNAPRLKKQDNLRLVIHNTTQTSFKEKIEESLKFEQMKYHKWQYSADIAQVIFVVFGLVLLYLATFFTKTVLNELFIIGGWVFIWLVCESEILEETKRRKKYAIIDAILMGEIEEEIIKP